MDWITGKAVKRYSQQYCFKDSDLNMVQSEENPQPRNSIKKALDSLTRILSNFTRRKNQDQEKPSKANRSNKTERKINVSQFNLQHKGPKNISAIAHVFHFEFLN